MSSAATMSARSRSAMRRAERRPCCRSAWQPSPPCLAERRFRTRGVKSRTRLFCSRLFRRCRRFCHLRRIHHSRSSRYFCRIRTQLIQFQVQRLIHAFHAFSYPTQRKTSPPRVLNPPIAWNNPDTKQDPPAGDSPPTWNNHPAYSPSNVPKHPDIGTIRTPTGLKTY